MNAKRLADLLRDDGRRRSERRWVLDMNALISRALLPGGTAARAVDRALASGCRWYRTRRWPNWQKCSRARADQARWPPDDRQRFPQLLLGVVRRVRITHRVSACRDPKDDKIMSRSTATPRRIVVAIAISSDAPIRFTACAS